MSERRAGLERGNVSVGPAEIGRRPPLTLEVSNRSPEPGRRGNGVDMCAKERYVNMGSPSQRGARPQRDAREGQARLAGVTERFVVAMKRVTIAERRDLGSESEGK